MDTLSQLLQQVLISNASRHENRPSPRSSNQTKLHRQVLAELLEVLKNDDVAVNIGYSPDQVEEVLTRLSADGFARCPVDWFLHYCSSVGVEFAFAIVETCQESRANDRILHVGTQHSPVDLSTVEDPFESGTYIAVVDFSTASVQ